MMKVVGVPKTVSNGSAMAAAAVVVVVVSLLTVRSFNNFADATPTEFRGDAVTITNDVKIYSNISSSSTPTTAQQQQRKLQTGIPLLGAAVPKSIFNPIKQIAVNAVGRFDPSTLFQDGIQFEIPPSEIFVFEKKIALPQLTPFTEDSITFDLVRNTGSPNDSILFQFTVSNLEAVIPSISIQATGSVATPEVVTFICNVDWTNLQLSLPPPSGIFVTLKTTAVGSTISAVVDQSTINLDTLSFPLTTGYTISGDPLCTEFSSEIDSAILDAQTDTLIRIKELLNETFINAFTAELVNLSFNIPTVPFGSGSIDLGIGFDVFGVSEDNQRVQIAVRSSPKGTITTIPHRTGSFYIPTLDDDETAVPAIPTILDKTLAATISVAGVNQLLATAFYLSWAEVTVNSTSTDSKACEPIDSDPCPFSELELITLIRNPGDLALKAAFLALRRYFRRGGFYNSFRINVALQPPVLTVSDDSIGGSVIASLYIQATKRFLFDGELRDMAKLDFPLVFEVDIPTLSNDGRVQNVNIKRLIVGRRNDGLDFNFYQPFPFQPTLRGRIALRFILLPIVRKFLPRFYGPINDAVAEALTSIVIPLSIDPIEFGGITLAPQVSDIAITADGETSTLAISANIKV